MSFAGAAKWVVTIEKSSGGSECWEKYLMQWVATNTVIYRKREAVSGSKQQCNNLPLQAKWFYLTFTLSRGNILCGFYRYFFTYLYLLFFCCWSLSLSSVCEVHTLFSILSLKIGEKRILEITLFWIKIYFGSIYIKPTSFVRLCYPFLQTPNHPSIPYQYGILPMGRGL